MRTFVNLKVHSIYSILESTLSIDKIAKLAVEKNQPAVCLTDNNLHGALEFCLKCKALNVKPIIGCKLLLNDKQVLFPKYQKTNALITVLVRSEEGYINLLKLVNNSEYEDGYYIININDLEKYSYGLICLVGEINGLAWNLYNKLNIENGIKSLNNIKDIFTNNNFCIELQRNVFANPQYEKFILDYAKENKLIIVATNETYFESPKDFEVHEVLKTICEQKTCISEYNYFKSYNEMLPRYSDIKYTLSNTIKVCSMCDFYLEKKPIALPIFSINRKMENRTLYYQAIKSLEYIFYSLGKTEKPVYYKRLIEELYIIINTKYSGYFLIVSDFILWAKNNNVYVGPGRGSGVGSLVAYCLGITNIDPLKYNLLFERFLNINRINLPDIDVDFCQIGREKVIRYIQSKYGLTSVGQIITFGSLQIRAAIKDVGKYLNIPYEKINILCKAIPSFETDIENIYTTLIKINILPAQLISKLMEIIIKLIGLYRHVSTHAAGLVISNSLLQKNIPIIWDEANQIGISQFSMNCLENVGLPKFDLLGLKTLTAVKEIIQQLINNRININLDCYNDDKSFQLICEGKVLGTFQLEGKGMNKHIKSIQPNNINELAALIALYRPGPLKHIKLYSDTKNKKISRISLHKAVDYILDETYGIVIYQEQVMLIAQKLAGYTLSEADILRKAMAKKDMNEMLVQKNRFVEGAVSKGIEHKLAIDIFNTLSHFADYGFNKSHAIAYSTLSYITSYLKANFPLEFYSVNMTTELSDSERISALYYDAIDSGIMFISPSVQMPINKFKVGNGFIQFPLNAIKGIGEPVVNSIYESKGKKRFNSLLDFYSKINYKIITNKIIKILILSGALDCFNQSRNQMLNSLDEMVVNCSKSKQNNILTHDNKPMTLSMLYEEYLLLGCYVSECPIQLAAEISGENINSIAIIAEQNNDFVTIITKNGKLEISVHSKHRFELGKAYKYTLKTIDDTKTVFEKINLINAK
ncbi:MAG: DNA polymerase III subunit alpha [Candidatus Hodgkinia cicadicola]